MKTEQRIINLQNQIRIWKSKIIYYQSLINGAEAQIKSFEGRLEVEKDIQVQIQMETEVQSKIEQRIQKEEGQDG